MKIAEREPNAAVVAKLEELLAEARSGEIRELAYVADYAKAFRNGCVGRGDRMLMIGEIVCMVVGLVIEHRLQDQMDGP